MRWYHELAWRLHLWVRPTPYEHRLGRPLSNFIAKRCAAIWVPAWMGDVLKGRG